MNNHQRIFTYIGIAAVVLLVVGLLGWYFFLSRQTTNVQNADQARGFSIGIPSFSGSRGSTAANSETGAPSGQSFGNAPSSSGGSAFLRLLGIGTGVRATQNPATNNVPPNEAARSPQTPRLWHVSTTPIAGAAFLTGSSTTVRYIERATGYVFDADPAQGTVTRLTNTLTPKIYDASVRGAVVAEHTLEQDRATTLVGEISTTTEGGYAKLNAKNLGSDIRDLVLLPNTDILMLTRAQSGLRIIRALWSGRSPKEIFSIPAGDFHLIAPAENRIYIVEKAASGVAGSAYKIGKSLTPLARAIPGLTLAIHPKMEAYLYGSDDGTALHLFAKLPDAAPAPLSIATIAEKCAWAPGTDMVAYCAVPQGTLEGGYLDALYSGAIHTNDVWYKVSASSGKADTFFTPNAALGVDVEHPQIDDMGNYLAFTNARDKSLWILRLPE